MIVVLMTKSFLITMDGGDALLELGKRKCQQAGTLFCRPVPLIVRRPAPASIRNGGQKLRHQAQQRPAP